MVLRETQTLARAAVRFVRDDLGGRVTFPRDRLGTVLELPGGDRFEVYRETALRHPGDSSGVVLEFRLDIASPDAGASLRALLAEPLANVATPFFAGLPGFRRKLWLAGEGRDEFLELYEWETQKDADRFVRLMLSLLAPLRSAGAASFDVVDDDSVGAYVARHSQGWRRPPRRRKRPWIAPVALGLAALVIGLAVARRRSGA